jgi:hypothetical protein
MEFFTAPGSAPFTVAILVMLGLMIVEVVALFSGASFNDIVDEFVVTHAGVETVGQAPTGIEGSSAPDAHSLVGRFLAWLYVGHVPVLMILIVFLTVFGLTGLVGQSILRGSVGFAVPSILAAPAVFLAALPIVRSFVGLLARIMPRDETSAVSVDSFVGRVATVTGGTARAGLPAQARLIDEFGTMHYVFVIPDDENDEFPTDSIVLLVRRISGSRFLAIPNPNQALVDDA